MLDYLCITEKTASKIRNGIKQDLLLCKLMEMIHSEWPDTLSTVSGSIQQYSNFPEEFIVQDGLVVKTDHLVVPES